MKTLDKIFTVVKSKIERTSDPLEAFRNPVSESAAFENPIADYVKDFTTLLNDHGISGSDVKKIANCFDQLRKARKRSAIMVDINNDRQVYDYFKKEFIKLLEEAKFKKGFDSNVIHSVRTKIGLLDIIHETR